MHQLDRIVFLIKMKNTVYRFVKSFLKNIFFSFITAIIIPMQSWG